MQPASSRVELHVSSLATMPGSERTLPPASPVPRWMSVGLSVALAIVVGFGLAGLAVADAGFFLPILVVPL